MTQTPIPKLVATLAVPTIISMLITSVYNMADTFFVGRISTSATGAVGVVFSLMAVIQAIGFTFGNGAGNYISRLLGQRDTQTASHVAAVSFFTSFLVGIGVTVLGLLFLNPLVRMLGATETILPYARDYTRLILIGAPFMTSSLVLNNLLRFQGSAFFAMIGIATGGILNIVLDPVFIFIFHMGIGGAALATIISQIVSFCILFANCGRGGSVRVRLREFSPSAEIYSQIFRGGLPSFYRQGLASVSTVFLNLAAGPFGDAAIAAMSIVTRVNMFASSALIGFGQGFQPVCGFNYGARIYQRVRAAFWFCVKIAFVVLLLLAVLGIVFAPQIVALFRRDDLAVIAIGTKAMRLQALTLPLMAWVIMNNMLLQTIGKTFKASLLALARQGLFFLPVILTLPSALGMLGVQLSQPVADAITILLAIPMGVSVLRELRDADDAAGQGKAPRKTLQDKGEAGL